MSDREWLAKKFEESRAHLESVAYRILGTKAEADDAVQEAWLRLTRSDTSAVENLGGWLTTVVARVCLDSLRSRKVRQEAPFEEKHLEIASTIAPDDELLLADSMGPALLVVLQTLTPPERVAFVLHDLFDLDFAEIATVIGRSEIATRQLASRARRKVRGPKENVDREKSREIVAAFLSASRDGDFGALLNLLDPGIVLRADDSAVRTAAANKDRGAPQFESEMHDARKIAELFKGRATAAQPALINGLAGATWVAGGKPRAAFVFVIQNGKISEIGVITDPEDLNEMEIKLPRE